MNRRRFLLSALAAPVVIRTAGLLMPVRKVAWEAAGPLTPWPSPEPAVSVFTWDRGMLRALRADEFFVEPIMNEIGGDATMHVGHAVHISRALMEQPNVELQVVTRDGKFGFVAPYVLNAA